MTEGRRLIFARVAYTALLAVMVVLAASMISRKINFDWVATALWPPTHVLQIEPMPRPVARNVGNAELEQEIQKGELH